MNVENERAAETVEYPIVGGLQEVSNVLMTLRNRGELLSHSAPLAFPDGRHVVMVRTVPPPVAAPVPEPPRVRAWPVVGVAFVLAFVTGIIYAIVIALMWVHAHWQIVVGALIVLAVVALKSAHYLGGGGGSRISGTFEGRIHR